MPVSIALRSRNKLTSFITGESVYRRRPFSTTQTLYNHYDTLGVPPTATIAQIKTNFYKLSQELHPDRNKDPGAVEKFQAVSQAYAVLKDGRDRREYDRKMKQSEEGPARHSGYGRHSAAYAHHDYSTDWSSHSRRHTRQSAEWAWSAPNSRSGGSAFRRPGTQHRNDPFSNPHVQRATGKARSHETFSSSNPSSSSSWYGSSGSSFSGGYNRQSTAGRRAEEENAREVDAQHKSGLWNTVPTIGVTLLFLMFAHGWGAKA